MLASRRVDRPLPWHKRRGGLGHSGRFDSKPNDPDHVKLDHGGTAEGLLAWGATAAALNYAKQAVEARA